MSGNLSEFNLNNTEAPKFGVVPAGSYTCVCTKASLKDNKNGSGKHISLEFRIMTGKHTGRKIFHNINVKHTNKDVEAFGLSELKALAKCLGIANLTDTSQLVSLPVVVHLKEKNGDVRVSGYDVFNGWTTPEITSDEIPF